MTLRDPALVEYERKLTAMWAAGIWSLIYSLYVYLVITGSIAPDWEGTTEAGIASAVLLVGITHWISLIHGVIQKWLERNRPGQDISRWLKAYDYLTSLAPAIAVVAAHIVVLRRGGDYASWWWYFVIVIDSIVIGAVAHDVVETIAFARRGRQPPPSPP